MANELNPIVKMQKNLSILRKINGWTTEELGLKIGVTKQTISNLENWKVNMTKAQYIALRSVFEYETHCVNENMTLQRVMRLIFYSEVDYEETTNNEIANALDNLAAAASGGIKGSQLFMLSTTLLSPMKLPVLSQAVEISDKPYAWMKELEDCDAEN